MSVTLIRGTRRSGHAGVADVRVRDGVMAMREAHRDWMDLQVVAFPQTGVTLAPWARPRWR